MKATPSKSLWQSFGIYVVLAIVIFVVPTVFNLFENRDRMDRILERVERISERCVEKAVRSNYSTDVCFEIETSTAAAISATGPSSFGAQAIILSLIYGLACGLVAQRQKIADLKERLDA